MEKATFLKPRLLGAIALVLTLPKTVTNVASTTGHRCGLRLKDAQKRTNDIMPCIKKLKKRESTMHGTGDRQFSNHSRYSGELKGFFSNAFTGSENARTQQRLKGAKVK